MQHFTLSVLFSLLCMLCISGNLQAQQPLSPKQQAQLSGTIQALKSAERMQARAVKEYIKKTGTPRRLINADGVTFELRRIENGRPYYDRTLNQQAAISTGTHHVQEGGRSGFNLMGTNMIVGEWDGGGVLTAHVEFEGRAIQRDDPFAPSNHATHVAGTLIAAGINPEAIGMAPEATLWAHDWNADGSEMAQAAAEGLLISNHSYGTIAGWARGDWSEEGNTRWHWWGDISIDSVEDVRFGYYDSRTASWDQIAHDAPYYLIVKSAGNNRNDNYSGPHMVRVDGEWTESDAFRRVGDPNGFDCLPTYSTSKNIMTIGAVRDVNGGYSGPSSVNMTSFSSWGPTDDGRIKPDIVGDGAGLLSANNSNATAYGRSSGTSMSGPNVAGSLLLLQELHRQMTGEFMLSSSLKGLAIHTADEAGNPGPDYSYGWGLLNTESAAEVLAQPLRHPFFQEELNPSDTFTYTLQSDGLTPIRATLCWTDPAAEVRPPALNDRTPRLVNDLDIRLIAQSGTDSGRVYRPFILDPENPAANAQRGDNFIDNVEMIDAGILPAGSYRLEVHHKNNLKDNESQPFSLWLSAPVSDCSFTISVDSLMQPLCPDAEGARAVMDTEGANGAVDFYLDGRNLGPDPVLDNIRSGRVFISALDSAGCFATTDVVIDRPETLPLGDFDRTMARIHQPIAERSEFAISTSFASGWGADPESNWWRGEALASNDGSANPILGCNPYTNDSLMNGKIAVVRRGSCQFGTKALRAQQAGAIACIIMNDEPGVIPMAPGDDGSQVSIPVFMISQSDGDALLNLMIDTAVILSLGSVPERRSPTCAGSDNGFIQVYAMPGKESVSFEWSTGARTESISDLGPGDYMLTITDQNGCTYEQEYLLTAPDTLLVDFDRIEQVTCPDTLDGRAAAIASGGQAPYQFSWSSGEQSSTATGLTAGWNQISVTDAIGCLRIDSVEIPAAPSVSADVLEILPSCVDTAVGQVSIRPQGTPPFSILWSDSLNSFERADLALGGHRYTLTDGCARQFTDSVDILAATDSIAVETNPVAADCFGDLGRISFELRGGRGPYEIDWSNGEITTTEGVGGNTFPEGWYSADLTDVCGTEATMDSFFISAPEAIDISITDIVGESCPGATDGAAILSLSGGTGELSIELDPNASLDSLQGGTYNLQVRDQNQCIRDTSFTVPSPDTLVADFSVETDGYELTVTNRSRSAADYLWDFGDGNTSTEVSPTHTYDQVGRYELCLQVQNDCGEKQLCQEVIIVLLSSPPADPLKAKLFPNPVRDRLRVDLPSDNGQIEVWSIMGQRIWEAPANIQQEIDVSKWAAGMYILRWEGQSLRFIVQ
jgi:hypothetical protein